MQLEQYAAHTSPGVESARNMTPGSCFSANSQQTESGYCGSIPLLSRSNSMLPSPIQSKSSDNHYQIPDHQQPIPQDQPPHITSCEIPQQQLVDPLSSSSAPLLPQYPSGGDTVYPQRTTSQPIQPACLEQSHSMIFSHSDHSDISSDHQSPASTHGKYVQHPSPHMQPVPGYQARQSQFISQSDLAAVQRALMHNRHCQIPGCCCQRVRELVEGSRGRMLYDSPEMSIASSGSGNSNRIHRVSHQVSSTDSDSDYSSYTDKRSRPPNLRLLSDEHNRNPNLHPHYHLTTKSHMRRVSVHAPVDHRRSRSLSDLTPLIEVPETPATTPPIGGSIKPGTPVYYQQLQPALGEDATEQFVKDDCSPMLLREISISSDNIPALCLNDCPFTPSPLKESCRMLAATPGRRKGSFRRASMRSTKPKLKTVKDNVPNEAEEEESSSSETEANQNISSDPVPPTTNPDPHMQCIGSSSQISMHSRASALQFETEI